MVCFPLSLQGVLSAWNLDSKTCVVVVNLHSAGIIGLLELPSERSSHSLVLTASTGARVSVFIFSNA